MLHDVRDTEAVCHAVALRAVKRWGWDGDTIERRYESLLTYLLEAAWFESRRYEQARGTFSTQLGSCLPGRAIDWLRSEDGRSKWSQSDRGRVERSRRPASISLDQHQNSAAGLALVAIDADPAQRSFLLDAVGTLAEADRSADGLHGSGDQEPDARAA